MTLIEELQKKVLEYNLNREEILGITGKYAESNASNPEALITKAELLKAMSYLIYKIPDPNSGPRGEFYPGLDAWAEQAYKGESVSIPLLFHLLKDNMLWQDTVVSSVMFVDIEQYHDRFRMFLDNRIRGVAPFSWNPFKKDKHLSFDKLKIGYNILWKGIEKYLKDIYLKKLHEQHLFTLSAIDEMIKKGRKKKFTVNEYMQPVPIVKEIKAKIKKEKKKK